MFPVGLADQVQQFILVLCLFAVFGSEAADLLFFLEQVAKIRFPSLTSVVYSGSR